VSSLPNPSAEGEARRDAAFRLLRARRREIIRRCTAAAINVAFERAEVCADDVRALVPIPPDISPKLMGAVFADLADEGIVRFVEYRKSRRPIAHARPLSVWRLADANRAREWLAAHPLTD